VSISSMWMTTWDTLHTESKLGETQKAEVAKLPGTQHHKINIQTACNISLKCQVTLLLHFPSEGKMEVPVNNTKYLLQYWNHSSTYATALSTHFSERKIFISLYYCKRIKKKKIKTVTKLKVCMIKKKCVTNTGVLISP